MEQATNQEVTAVEIYNRSIQTFHNGSAILAANQETASKAIAAGQGILTRIQASGGKLDESLDNLCREYLAKCAQRKREFEEARKPITQIMDQVRKLFTTEEAKLDVKASGTVPYIIQDFRNGYAREVAEEQKRRQEEAAQKAAKEKEAVEIKAACETQLLQHFTAYLSGAKNKMHQAFNQITLAGYEESLANLQQYEPVYPYEHYTSFKPSIVQFYHNNDEVGNIVLNVTSSRFDGFASQYKEALLETKQMLLDRMPSKKTELEQLAKASAEEAQRLEQQRRQREEEEAARRKQEEDAQRRKQEEEIAAKKAEGETMAMFAGIAEQAAVSAPVPETRQGYQINVLHQGGWALIFQFWFQREGCNLAIDKIGSKKLDSMKTFCESYAHKHNEKIESPYLSYEPTYKAVNRKTVAA